MEDMTVEKISTCVKHEQNGKKNQKTRQEIKNKKNIKFTLFLCPYCPSFQAEDGKTNAFFNIWFIQIN